MNKQETSSNAVGREADMVPIFIMGKRYEVPDGLTIMKAMEYAGYKFIRGCGCRGGICGACGTVYRKPDDYKIYSALACQTTVEPNMHLTQIPFYPANHARCSYEDLTSAAEEIHKKYPELFRCVACNACSKVCPMDVEVMDVISYIKRGDVERAAFESFDCIQCGLCTSRCFAEMPQYHIMQLARRIYGGKIAPRSAHNDEAARKVCDGAFEDMMQEVMHMNIDDLKKAYTEREIEPETAGEDWRPSDKRFLVKDKE
ncbi:MAG: 4Fe-4S dicluster domain-containing protein [Deltaproteobacteria bacterium]|nr:4Fe-4S dicluster domain-containing protein [Deltaproteobacteria bacterium]